MYRPGTEIGHAGGLTRLPLPDTAPKKTPIPGEIIQMIESIDRSQVNTEQIAKWTERDPILSRIRRFVMVWWPLTSDRDISPFEHRKDELSMENGCLLLGTRVVIPKQGQEPVVGILHEGHPGISKMKSLAREFVWWPGMGQQLENKVKSQCQLARYMPFKVPLHPWEWPERPWSRSSFKMDGSIHGVLGYVVCYS